MIDTKKVDVHSFSHAEGQRIFLVDTPGFDDSYCSDVDILGHISHVLLALDNMKLKLAGVIFMQDIQAQIRMTASARRQLDVFKAICGQSAYPHVVCVTSMWNCMSFSASEAAEKRMERLRSDPNYWEPIIMGGGITMKWFGEIESALTITGHIVEKARGVENVFLNLQSELLRQGKYTYIERTTAGRIISSGLVQEAELHRTEIQESNKNIQRAQQDQNQRLVDGLLDDRKWYEHRLKRTEEAVAKLQQKTTQLKAEKKASFSSQVKDGIEALTPMQASNPSPAPSDVIVIGSEKTKKRKTQRLRDALHLDKVEPGSKNGETLRKIKKVIGVKKGDLKQKTGEVNEAGCFEIPKKMD